MTPQRRRHVLRGHAGPVPRGGGGNVQPATAYMLVNGTTGCPLTSTRGFGDSRRRLAEVAAHDGGAEMKQGPGIVASLSSK